MKKNLLLILLSSLSVISFSQSGYYFQQEVNYKIDVKLNDKEHSLSAFEEFEYINNSSQQLDSLIIHLWPNAYKNAKTAMSKQKFEQGDFFMLWADQKAKGYIDSLDFTVDGQKARWNYLRGFEDIAVLYLNEPLHAGGRIKVATPFYVKLPSGSISRLGHIGESYQVTQWYPKPAVFDKEGWHEMPYLTQGEFFSEFGSFDVSITLPDNYTVGATGDLQTQSEIDRMNELAKAPLPIVAKPAISLPGRNNDESKNFPPSSSRMKTLRYVQRNVHDFGWFADKRWIVRKGEVELPHSKRKVTSWALFTPDNAAVWDAGGVQAINDALYHYSLWSGDYPYDVCTAVDGTISAGGGMEYPNVTVIGSTGGEQELKTVIVHEVGHNWFYGILGSNERDNAWMDEGINSFFETRTMLATAKETGKLSISVGGFNAGKVLGLDRFSYQYITEELPYLWSVRGNKDQPIQAPSEYYTNLNYGTIVYKKTALAFNYLMNYLGEETFNKCMAAYFEQWKFKHPSPKDIRQVFETTSGRDLSWFFADLILTKDHVDYKATCVKVKGNEARLTVKNDGEIAGPFSVDVIRDGKLSSRQWFDGIESCEKTSVTIPAQKGDIIKLNNVTGIPEFNRNNNNIKTKGIMRRSEPYSLKLFSGVDDPERSQLFWMPLVGWNNYNKWMLGLQLHNKTIPEKNYKWSIAPLYSIATKTMNGFARIEYDNGRIGFGIRGQRFAEDAFPYDGNKFVRSYHVIAPYFRVALFPERLRKDWSGNVEISLFSIGEMIKDEHTKFVGEYIDVKPQYGSGSQLTHLRMKANIRKKFPRSEFRFFTSFEGGEYTGWSIFHQHSLSYDFVYHGKGRKKIRTRLYYGGADGFYLNAAGQYGGARYDKNSPYNNIPGDYLYEGLFFGRNETNGIMSQQFMRTQGGLAAPTQQSANKNIFSLNIEIDAPVKLPIGLYAGAAVLQNQVHDSFEITNGAVLHTNTDTRFLWNAGISVPIVRNMLQVYIPVIYSQNIKDEVKARDLDFGQTLLFELNLNLMNPLELIKSVGN